MLPTLLELTARTYRYGGDYNYGYSYSADEVAATGLGIMVVLMVVFFALIFGYVINSLFHMLIFKKAGLKASTAWIPFYSQWKFLELGGQPGWTMLLNFIPFFGTVAYVVFLAMAAYNIGLKLEKQGAFVILFILFAPAWYLVLGLDNSQWDDSLGQPSLAEGTILGYATEEEVVAETETKE